MIVIRSIDDLIFLNADLLMFVLGACPWITFSWNPNETGFVYILRDIDRHSIKSLTTQLQLAADGRTYQKEISVNLTSYDRWKSPAYFNKTIGYWCVVAVLDQDHEATFILSAGFVKSIRGFNKRLKNLRERC
jgi:hypothetical protein